MAGGDQRDVASLTTALKAEALRLGFDAVGIAPAVSPPGYPSFLEWLKKGHAAGMGYMSRQAEARAHPESILPGVRSVVMGMMVYGEPEELPTDPRRGKVARYARGADYHRLMWDCMDALLDWLRREVPTAKGRAVCDTAPLLERDFARLASLGWIGKNAMLIHKRLGTFTFLGGLLVDLELAYDTPFEANHCGTCTRCLDACPTDAFVGPGELDAGRCISYWTIEHRGPIPDEWAAQLDGWAFGCDVCQDVCPWNRKAPAGREPALGSGKVGATLDLIEWLEMDDATVKARLKGTALERTRRSGILRNIILLLGTAQSEEAVEAIKDKLDDADPSVRWAAAWGLGRIGSERALEALRSRGVDPEDSQARGGGAARRLGGCARGV